MSNFTLTKTRLFEGVWEGILTATTPPDSPPDIVVTHLEKPVSGVKVTQDSDAGHWVVRVPVPVDTICDGVQVFLINDGDSGDLLASFTILSGEALDDDHRAEMELLRAELDMLKRAFRRHCLETM